MARTILAIAREAAERDATAPAPAQLFGSNNKIARTLRVAAVDTIREFLRRPEWLGLSEFTSTWAFSLHPGRFAYELPPDYLRMVTNTEHRGGWPMGLCGPTSPQTWANWIFGGAAAPVEMGWRIRNNAIFIEPTPTKYELITIEYVSRFPVVSQLRTGDYDYEVTPPRCNAPFVPRDGYVNLPTELDIGGDPGEVASYDEPPGYDVGLFGAEMADILRRINVTSAVAPLPEVRRPEFVADTDKPAFEDDYLLSLGMTWRLRRSLGMDYAEHAAEYEEELERKISSDAGGPRAFLIGNRRREDDIAPLGDGKWLVT